MHASVLQLLPVEEQEHRSASSTVRSTDPLACQALLRINLKCEDSIELQRDT
jgi:hypothetical protein